MWYLRNRKVVIDMQGNNKNGKKISERTDIQLTTKLLAPTPVFPLKSIIAPSSKPCYYAIRINYIIKPMLVSCNSHL